MNENKIENYIIIIGFLILLFIVIWWIFFGGQEWISNQIFEWWINILLIEGGWNSIKRIISQIDSDKTIKIIFACIDNIDG